MDNLNSNRLVVLASQDAQADFERNCEALHAWTRARLDLCGGWLPDIDTAYFPHISGYYTFRSETARALKSTSLQVGRLYRKLGEQIESYFAGSLLSKPWPFDSFSDAESSVINRVGSPCVWTSMLRPDFLLENGATPKIVEVNVGNPAGLEELVMFLRFYTTSFEVAPALRVAMGAEITRLSQTVSWWLDSQYKIFLQSRPLPTVAHFAIRPRIAVVYEDRSDSFFLAKYLARFLGDLGYDTLSCRPENMSFDGAQLTVETAAAMKPRAVDIVIRDWMFEEMFAKSSANQITLKPQFEPLIQAAERKAILMLNPLAQRLLGSKMIISELQSGRSDIFSLTDEELEFARRHIVKTSALRPDGGVPADLTNIVLKPANSSGGKSVFIGGERQSGTPPVFSDAGGNWVLQEKVPLERERCLYRKNGSAISNEEIFVSHGMLIYDVSREEYVLGGVTTTASLDPVVSFQRGGQVLPSILESEE